jgi:hypothetical protein
VVGQGFLFEDRTALSYQDTMSVNRRATGASGQEVARGSLSDVARGSLSDVALHVAHVVHGGCSRDVINGRADEIHDPLCMLRRLHNRSPRVPA